MKNLTVTISRFNISDYEEVYHLWQSCSGIGLSSADSAENIAAYLERNPGMSFIARAEQMIVGAILGGHDGRRGYIHHLAVRDDYRRQGIGKQLVEHCLNRLSEEGMQKCHLFIFHENYSGIAFWQDCGWTFRQDIRVMSAYLN